MPAPAAGRETMQTKLAVQSAFPFARASRGAVASLYEALTTAPSLELGAEAFVDGNFLVRSREKVADHDFMVAVVDAPSDLQDGWIRIFRISKNRAIDTGPVAEHLKSQASLPVWLVGTSAGTISAIDLPGYAGKKIKGKKHPILVDALGLLLIVHGADIQDRDGGIMLLSTMFGMHPFPKKRRGGRLHALETSAVSTPTGGRCPRWV